MLYPISNIMNMLRAVAILFASSLSMMAATDGTVAWSIHTSYRDNLDARDFGELATRRDSVSGRMETVAPGLPKAAIWPEGDREKNAWNFRVRAESDKSAKAGKGDLILRWQTPAAGSWKLTLNVRNDGLDVKGGDGGRVIVTKLSQNEYNDTASVFVLQIPSSKLQPPKDVSAEEVVKLQAGDRIHLRFSAKIDGYGDQFLGVFSATPATGSGREISPADPASSLPQVPSVKKTGASPFRSGLFLLGVNGRWACSPFAEETVRLIHQHIPNLGVVMMMGRPEQFPRPEFYNALGIPTIVQSIGRGWEPFFKAEGAYEIDWAGRDLSKKLPGVTLSGDAHAISLPHPATWRAFEQLSKTAIRSGHSGHGFPDMVWMWGAGRGRTGHNPATIAAFRRDLLGTDEGFRASLNGGPLKTMKLRDYAEYYLGNLPPPSAFGLKSWADYEPMRRPAGKPPAYHPEYLLFDLLAHYEWLKLADFLGQTAVDEGGSFQCMPNPEDVANGCDFYFLNALPSVRASSEEYFQSVTYLDGAYYRFNYLTSERRAPQENGLVLESGGGGNQWPYYDHEVAYLAAYELTLATSASHLEGDFWPGSLLSLDGVLENEARRERAKQLMAFGLGFSHAKEDAANRVEPDFISISSRRIFRPWGTYWRPWQYRLDNFPAPDKPLAQGGYVFEGMGEEVLLNAKKVSGKPMLYSPSTATAAGWTALISKLETGEIPAAIVAAPGIENVIDTDFQMRPFAEIAPRYAHKQRPDGVWSGRVLAVTGSNELLADGKLAGPLFDAGDASVVITLGGQPLVVRRMVKDRPLYSVLFDPSLPENAPVTTAVYGHLLKQSGVIPHWTTPADSYARVYQSGADNLVIGVQSADVRDWAKQTQGRPSLTARLAYATKPETGVTVRVKTQPDTLYSWVALPSGKRDETASDKAGWLKLEAKGVSWQTFHVFPSGEASRAKLDQLAKRTQSFQAAIALTASQ